MEQIKVSYSRGIKPADYENITASCELSVAIEDSVDRQEAAEGLMAEARAIAEGEFGLKLQAAAETASKPAGKKGRPAGSKNKPKAGEDPTAPDPVPEAPAVVDDPLGMGAVTPVTKSEAVSPEAFKKELLVIMQTVPGTAIAAAFTEKYNTAVAAEIPDDKRREALDLAKSLAVG